MSLKMGDVFVYERTFTKEDVASFTKVSKDEGRHHVEPDDAGRLVVQGLLTATLPTKIGGDYSVLARKMTFEFFRPVFTGDTIRCTVTIDEFRREKDRTKITASFQCTNQMKKVVMSGSFSGVIL